MMKKSFLLCFFAVTSAMSLFTSCSDDEDTTWKEIPEITEDNVSLKLNDKVVTGATASMKIMDAETAMLTLNNAIFGHEKVDVNVTLTKKDDTSYHYVGTAKLQKGRTYLADWDLEVKVSGVVTTSGKLTVDVETAGWGAISGEYVKDNLEITVNGKSQASTYAVTVVAQSRTAATLTFEKLVNIANDFTMDVTVTDGKIEGTKEKETGYNVNVTGEIKDGKLTVAVATTGYATLNGSYYATGNDITYHADADQMLPNGAYVSVKMLSESKAKLVFGNLLSGSREGGIEEVAVVASDGVYTFKGKGSESGYTLAFEGIIDANRKMTATVTYTTDCELVGQWKPLMEGSLAKTLVKLTTKSGTVTFPKAILDMLPAELRPMFAETMPVDQVSAILNGLLGTYSVYLQNLTFTEGGRMVATYIDMPKDINGDGQINASDWVGQAPKSFDLLKYYPGVSSDQFFLTVNLSDLMGMMSTNNSGRAWDPGTMLTKGIPFTYVVDANSALITITDEVVNVKTLEMIKGLLGAFGSMIPGFADNKPMIDAVMEAVASVLGETVELQVGLNVQKM